MSIIQPLQFSSQSVPVLDAARFSLRRQGDGMDSEALSSGHSPTSRNQQPKRHTNLNNTDRYTSITKRSSPNFIPHEPVKGAVKPVTGQDAGFEQDQQPSVPYVPPTFQEYLKSKTALKKNVETSHKLLPNDQTKLTLQNELKPSPSVLSNKPQQPSYGGTTKQVQIPVYAAPSNLSHKTYQTLLSGKVLHKAVDPPVKVDSKIETDYPEIIQIPGKDEVREGTPPDDERQIEGQLSRGGTEQGKLQQELKKAKEELEVQININADLKKLLVASVGDDLHYKVETLVRTKAHLAEEIGGYTKKMTQDYEDIDQLSIQADMWRSKYMASRVLVDQLASNKESFDKEIGEAKRAIQQMLLEREQLNDWLIESHRYGEWLTKSSRRNYSVGDFQWSAAACRQYRPEAVPLEEHLKLTRDSFDPPNAQRPPPCIPNMMELARDNLLLAESIKFRLLGSMTAFPAALDAGIQNGPTPAEKLAYQVISTAADGNTTATSSTTSTRLPSHLLTRMERFHPKARYDNITFNCCRKCKGQVQVV